MRTEKAIARMNLEASNGGEGMDLITLGAQLLPLLNRPNGPPAQATAAPSGVNENGMEKQSTGSIR